MHWSVVITKFTSSRKRLTWKVHSLNFRQFGERKQTKKAVQQNIDRESKRDIQYIHFLHKGYSEFIILSRMDI